MHYGNCDKLNRLAVCSASNSGLMAGTSSWLFVMHQTVDWWLVPVHGWVAVLCRLTASHELTHRRVDERWYRRRSNWHPTDSNVAALYKLRQHDINIHCVSKACTNFETVYLEIIRIDFDEIRPKCSKDSRIEFACFSFHVGLLFSQLFVFQTGHRR